MALLLATLARFETFILLSVIAAILAATRVASSFRWNIASPRRAWLLLIGFAALPVYMLHDCLLTGNPLYTEAVPALASSGAPIVGPLGALGIIASHYGPMTPLLLLAVVGVIGLVRRRCWPILVGLAALGPGLGLHRVSRTSPYLHLCALFRPCGPVDPLRCREWRCQPAGPCPSRARPSGGSVGQGLPSRDRRWIRCAGGHPARSA